MNGINPSVQVALISIFTTIITTAGVIVVALLNRQKEQAKQQKLIDNADINPAHDDLDIEEILDRMLVFIDDIERKEKVIKNLRFTNRLLREEVKELRDQLGELLNEE